MQHRRVSYAREAQRSRSPHRSYICSYACSKATAISLTCAAEKRLVCIGPEEKGETFVRGANCEAIAMLLVPALHRGERVAKEGQQPAYDGDTGRHHGRG